MSTFHDLGHRYYSEYLYSRYWIKLKHELLIKNPIAKCWVCESRRNLLLHHIRYDMIGREELGKSLYVICFDCHEAIHFRRFLFFKLKTPLETRKLLIVMKWLRFVKCVQKGKVGASILALLSWFFS